MTSVRDEYESGIKSCDKWHEHKPVCVMENKDYKIYWDFIIQCDRLIEARKPDVVLIDKRAKEVKIIDIAIPGDKIAKDKEIKKARKIPNAEGRSPKIVENEIC